MTEARGGEVRSRRTTFAVWFPLSRMHLAGANGERVDVQEGEKREKREKGKKLF